MTAGREPAARRIAASAGRAHNQRCLPDPNKPMSSHVTRVRRWGRLVALVLLLALPASAWSQTAPPPQPSGFSQDLPSEDFLFGRPRATLAVRASLVMPGENSDVFRFVQEQLTIDRGAFRSPAFVAELAVPITSRIDVVGGFDFVRKWVASEYRDFVDNDLLPIEQRSLLRQNGLTGSVRVALLPRGRQIGRFAWIPSRVQPYVGAGGGLVFWEFQQNGDFVDFQDFSVFTDTFRSSGTAPSMHVLGGADIVLHKRLMLSIEGRQQWARGTLSDDFVGFDPIDLSGFRGSAGISIAF